MTRPLDGRTVALAESRQLEELAQMLEKEGAVALRCPLVNILDAPDETPVRAWLDDLAAGRFDWTVFMTGEAVRRLMAVAEKQGVRDQVLAGLRATPIVTRGPKPVRAFKEWDIKPTLVADKPTTEGVINALKVQPLRGLTVGYTLYGGPNPPLEQFLSQAGAVGRPVLAYVYAPAADAERVADLISRMAQGMVDCILFTSSPQVERLVEVADERGLEDALRLGWDQTRVAAVGPVVAGLLRQHGTRVDICPEQGFVMKNLVQLIKREFGK